MDACVRLGALRCRDICGLGSGWLSQAGRGWLCAGEQWSDVRRLFSQTTNRGGGVAPGTPGAHDATPHTSHHNHSDLSFNNSLCSSRLRRQARAGRPFERVEQRMARGRERSLVAVNLEHTLPIGGQRHIERARADADRGRDAQPARHARARQRVRAGGALSALRPSLAVMPSGKPPQRWTRRGSVHRR